MKEFFNETVHGKDSAPGAVIAIQTFGDFPLGFHPHLHILVSDGCFYENGLFSVKIPCILEPELTDKAFRKNWARSIQKIEACPGRDPGRSIPSYAPSAFRKCVQLQRLRIRL